MEFGFSEQEQLFGDAVRRYARERLAADYQKWDSGAKFPREKLRELAEVGITGLRVPEEYGGSAGSYVMAGIASEELGRYDYNTTAFIQLTAISADILKAHAKDEIKRAWLPRLATGEGLISFGLTEPGTGSDAAAITTNAKREGDYYVINGEKASITFAGMADACILFARTGGAGARGIGAILVPLDSPGVSRQVYRSAGGRLTQRGGLVFDNVRVSIENRLGTEGGGFYQAMAAFDYNRALIALACIGAAQQSIEEAVAYAKQRRTFGKPIAEREGVSFQISEHLTMLAAARLLSYQCLTLCDQGKPHTTEAAMAKLLGPKASAEAIHACLILHGWIGYSQELPFEQRWRDVVGLEIGDGTPEIMKGIIARETFGREFNTYR